MTPVKSLSFTDKVLKKDKSPSDDGMLPEKLLKSKARRRRFDILPNSEGIVEVNAFRSNPQVARLVNSAYSAGRVPVIAFRPKPITSKNAFLVRGEICQEFHSYSIKILTQRRHRTPLWWECTRDGIPRQLQKP